MTDEIVKNRYRILGRIGRGAFGETFLAEDMDLPSRKHCVLKRLKPIEDPEKSEYVKRRFEREAAILETIGRDSQGRIPELHAYFPENGFYYLVQEWIDGPTLGQWIEANGRMNEAEVRDLVAALLEILEYIHSRRIIHRDIKLENVLLRKDGRPVLIDFGVMKEIVNVDTRGNPTSSIMAGTPAFMAFEQAAGKPVFASDIYSLGVTAVCLLVGEREPGTMTDPLTGDMTWRESVPDVCGEFAAVLNKAVESHFRDRYKTATEMKAAMTGLPSIDVRAVPKSDASDKPVVEPPSVSQNATTVEATKSSVSPPSPVIQIVELEPPRPEAGKPFINSIGMRFAWTPAGKFMMGSNQYDSEEPIHEVTIRKGFHLGVYQVTQGQWKTVIGKHLHPAGPGFPGDANPVERVSWEDAQEFLRKLNINEEGNTYRLPSEAEWEYACRAGTTGDYAGDLEEMAWYSANAGGKPHPVGQKKPNGWGLYDMHGNVWEWCEDVWHDTYKGAPTDGSVWTGGNQGRRVVRGGSWYGNPGLCRSAHRGRERPVYRGNLLGFRVLISAGTLDAGTDGWEFVG